MMKKLFVVLVILVLLLPLAFYLTGGTELVMDQPDFLLADKSLNSLLVRGWGWLHGVIGDTGSPQVTLGKEDTLFFTPALNSAIGAERLGGRRLNDLAGRITGVSTRLAQAGTRFVLLIVPDKAQMYPHMLPWYIRPVLPADTDSARLIARLHELGVAAPDLRTVFANQPAKTYLKTDTHWNAYGAYLAFLHLITAADYADPYGFTLEDFNKETPLPGDLIPLFLPCVVDPQTDRLPPLERAYRTQTPMRGVDDLHIKTSSNSDGPSIYAARDSFGRALFPYLANMASNMVFTRDYAHFEEQAKGFDLAVLVIAERSLGDLGAYLAPVD